MLNDERSFLPYRVGGLLYTPAINSSMAEKIEKHEYSCLTSVAFCLEDSIQDEALEQAQYELKNTLRKIKNLNLKGVNIPLLFVRIRTPRHMEQVHNLLGEDENILTGYILPKFDMSNAGEYTYLVRKYNEEQKNPLFIMPILESKAVADISVRFDSLYSIKTILDDAHEYVLNVRVGGNDFSNLYGLRRSVKQTIYNIGVIRDILTDIINVFGSDYVVSGPVWEYFGQSSDEAWAEGLRAELEADRINGFIGKTAIHPSQLPIIFESLKVSNEDYEDALKILNWSSKSYGVEKSAQGSRMNEVKCHTKWAKRIYTLGQVYGIIGEDKNENMV